MDREPLESTRRSLHVLAEQLLAGPQYARSGDIRLQVTANGFATLAEPRIEVRATELVTATDRFPITGSVASLAALAGVRPRDLRDVYSAGPTMGVDDTLAVDEQAARLILSALSRGDAAMRRMTLDEAPVLWPEHFDVGIAFDEVNYGVSPGDSDFAEPYAYVGPWEPRSGPFWNTAFGAARLMRDLPGVDDVLEFFSAGGAHASDDRRG